MGRAVYLVVRILSAFVRKHYQDGYLKVKHPAWMTPLNRPLTVTQKCPLAHGVNLMHALDGL